MRQYSCARSNCRIMSKSSAIVNAREHNRQIAGDSLRPQRRHVQRACAPSTSAVGTQGRIGIEHGVREPLEEMRLVGADSQVMQLHLRLRPRQRERALEGSRVAILVGQIQDLFARGGNNRGKNQMRPCLPGGMWTVRRRLSTGSSTEPTVLESGRPSMTETGLRRSRPRPTNRARSVSYCNSPDGFAFHDQHMRDPDRRFRLRSACGAWPAALPTSATNSVSTNRFAKAGCATSAACGVSESSA